MDARIAEYAAASAATRAWLNPVLGVRYGSGEKETLDVFPADRPNAPVQLFIHGGYWRAMDKSDYSFIADVFHSAGAVTVLVNYDLCPAVTLDTIVVQVNRAIAWTFRNVAEYGGDPHRLYVSGNSAGGHLDAMALAHDWEADEGIPADVIKGAVPVTGVFDCEPVPDVTVNEEVRLDRETARRLSPIRNPPRRVLPVLVAVGSAEPPLWIRMSKDYAALCREHGILRVHGAARPGPSRRKPGPRRPEEPSRQGDGADDGAVVRRTPGRVSRSGRSRHREGPQQDNACGTLVFPGCRFPLARE